MKRTEIEALEKITGRLDGLHKEVSALARKSPNDAINTFKLKFVNAVMRDALEILGSRYKPLGDFENFEEDDVPTNSDVTFVIAQYLEEAERKRADNIEKTYGGWIYSGTEDSPIYTAPPKKVSSRK